MKKNKSLLRSLLSWIGFFFILLIIFFTFKVVLSFIFVSGESMQPSIDDRDLLLTSNIFYEIERNDIVLYKDKYEFNTIKRVIGMPGEVIEIKNGIVYINDKALEEPFTSGKSTDMEAYHIPEKHYFVIGDNRHVGESLDSRSPNIGAIHRLNVKGEIVLSLFPFGTK